MRVLFGVLVALLPACVSVRVECADEPSAEVRAIEGAVDELYRAFSFGPGGEADWDGMRELFLDGATFVSPIADGSAPATQNVDEFLAGFREWSTTGEWSTSGLHERVTHVAVRRLGHIATTWVTFEGFVPGESDAETLGVDAIQWVRSPVGWRLASFATQYANDAIEIPADVEFVSR